MTRDGAVAWVKQLLKPLNISFYQTDAGADTFIIDILQKGIDDMTSLKGIYAQYDNSTSPLDADTSMTLQPRLVSLKSMNFQETITGVVHAKTAVTVATTAVLPACTAAGMGVGKTLTMTVAGILTVDGVATVLSDRILVKNQVTAKDNGIYTVTTAGTASVAAILTRATDADADADVLTGMSASVTSGTTNKNKQFVLTTVAPIVVDFDVLAFSDLFSGDAVAMYPGVHYMPHGTIIEFISGPPPNEPRELTGIITVTCSMLGAELLENTTVVEPRSPYDMAPVYYACSILSQQSQSDKAYEWMTQYTYLKRQWLAAGDNDIIMLVHPLSDDAADITV